MAERPEDGFELEEEGLDPLAAAVGLYALVCFLGLVVIVAIAGERGWNPVAGAAVGALGGNFIVGFICAVYLQRHR